MQDLGTISYNYQFYRIHRVLFMATLKWSSFFPSFEDHFHGYDYSLLSSAFVCTYLCECAIQYLKVLLFSLEIGMCISVICTFRSYIIGIDRESYLTKGMKLWILAQSSFLCMNLIFVEIYLSKYLQQIQNPKIRFTPFSELCLITVSVSGWCKSKQVWHIQI